MDIFKYLHLELLAWLTYYRTELGYAFASGTTAVLRCLYHGESFKNTCAEGCMCALAAFGISEILVALDWSPDLAFPASVFLGYLGIASLMRFLRLKKAPDESDRT